MKNLLLYSKLSVVGLLLTPILLNKRGRGWLPRFEVLTLAPVQGLVCGGGCNATAIATGITGWHFRLLHVLE